MIPLDTAADVGETLRLLRQLAGMSQSDVDARSGVCFTRISRMERGLTVPDTRTLLRLLAALGYRLAIVPLATDGPQTGLSATESADRVETGTDPRVSESEAAETLSGGAA